jgi:phosphopantetheine adenylyltransferase
LSSKKLAQSVSSVCDFRLESDIASTDREIDELVYELYGITDEERRVVEASSARLALQPCGFSTAPWL